MYLRNRCCNNTEDVTPYEKLFNSKPDLGHIRIFGSNAYMHIPHQKRGKLDSKTKLCILVGYAQSSKVYRLWNSQRNVIITAKDVRIDETNININYNELVVAPDVVETSQDSIQDSIGNKKDQAKNNSESSQREEVSNNENSSAMSQEEEQVKKDTSFVKRLQLRRSNRLAKIPLEYEANYAYFSSIVHDPVSYKQALSSRES